MSSWIIEPREPLIVRDGRPFDRQPGVLATSLPFPFPSTVAGAARQRAGLDKKSGVFAATDISALKSIQVRGPLLVELKEEGEQNNLLVPAPGDALLLEEQEQVRLRQLVPLQPPDEELMQAFSGTEAGLAPVGLTPYSSKKPAKRQPAFWHWNGFERWLAEPGQTDRQVFTRESLGIQPLPQEQRVHVALERGMMVAQEGLLFETRGLEFTVPPGKPRELSQARRLALWLEIEPHAKYSIEGGLDCLGAERRLVKWQQCPQDVQQDILRCPKKVREQIVRDTACRLVLLTPACFQQGYLPGISNLEYSGIDVKVALRAALVQRPQVISGWDIERNQIRPTRRLAPAGSVFFLKLEGRPDAIHAWVQQTWMSCVSDLLQDRRDGFGLAALGTWPDKFQKLEVKESEA